MENFSLKRLDRWLEFFAVAAGLFVGVLFLEPMMLQETRADISKVSSSQGQSFYGYQSNRDEFEKLDGVYNQTILPEDDEGQSI